jgi:hypothetical protein
MYDMNIHVGYLIYLGPNTDYLPHAHSASVILAYIHQSMAKSKCTFREEMMMFLSYYASHFQKLEQYSRIIWRKQHRDAFLMITNCLFWKSHAVGINIKKNYLHCYTYSF